MRTWADGQTMTNDLRRKLRRITLQKYIFITILDVDLATHYNPSVGLLLGDRYEPHWW